MTKVRIATFNAENLFARYRFNDETPGDIVTDGWKINDTKFSVYDETSKELTSLAIKEAKADILALQEIENHDVLKKFRTTFLGGYKTYPYTMLVSGNDPRLIDVAVMSKFPIKHARSYMHLRRKDNKWWAFSRDCLEVDVAIKDGFNLTLFINHFKSMLDKSDPKNGRKNTRAKRVEQSEKVMEIVKSRFGENPGNHLFIILGDLNDYLETDNQGTSGIKNLVEWDQIENVIDRLPKDERWTHYYKGHQNSGDAAYKQLDYILPSKSISQANPDILPEIIRNGMPLRASKYQGPRFEGIGQNKPKASDHCPFVFEIEVE